MAAQCLADGLFVEAWFEALAWMIMCRFASEMNVRGVV